MRAALVCAALGALVAAGEAPPTGLVARWHDYVQMLMFSTEIVRTERFDGGRYRLDMAAHPLASMDSQGSSPPLYFDRETSIDSLETPGKVKPAMLIDPAAKRIVTFNSMSDSELVYTSYRYDRTSWKGPPPPQARVSALESLGVDTVAGYRARHYRAEVENDSLASFAARLGGEFPARFVTDVWIAGPDPLLDEYFAALSEIPNPVWDFDPKTAEPALGFQRRGVSEVETAVTNRFHDAGHVVRAESRIEFHGPGVGAMIPPEMDPARRPAADAAADTVRSLLLSRDALASLRRAAIPEAELGMPAGAKTTDEWKKAHGLR